MTDNLPPEADNPTPSLGVIVIDPLPMVRAGLALLISSQSDMTVQGEAGDAAEALKAVRAVGRRSGLVILVGLGLKGERDSFWLIRALREELPMGAIVACGANTEKMAISRALFVGADGFVDKNANPREFFQALRSAAQGEVAFAGLPHGSLGRIAEGVESQRDADSLLTDREKEVLTIAAEGLTAREIAVRLKLQERTITTHLGRIYGKLGVHGRVAAIAAAAQMGIVTVGGTEG
jgi:DNA-binding NarL/FixJ family response regulator